MPRTRRAAPSTKKTTLLSIQLRVCVCLPSTLSNPPTAVNPRNLRSAAKSGMTGKWKGRFEMSRQRLYLAAEVYLGRCRPVPLLRDRWRVQVTQDPSAVHTRLGPLPQWRQAVVLLQSTEGPAAPRGAPAREKPLEIPLRLFIWNEILLCVHGIK